MGYARFGPKHTFLIGAGLAGASLVLSLVALGVWGRDGAVPECKPADHLELSAVDAAADAHADAHAHAHAVVGGSDELSARVAETKQSITAI